MPGRIPNRSAHHLAQGNLALLLVAVINRHSEETQGRNQDRNAHKGDDEHHHIMLVLEVILQSIIHILHIHFRRNTHQFLSHLLAGIPDCLQRLGMIATGFHQNSPSTLLRGNDSNGIMLRFLILAQRISTMIIGNHAAHLIFMFTILHSHSEPRLVGRNAIGTLRLFRYPNLAIGWFAILFYHLESQHLHRRGICHEHTEHSYYFFIVIMHAIFPAYNRIGVAVSGLFHLRKRFQTVPEDSHLLRRTIQRRIDVNNILRLITQGQIGKMLHLEHHRYRHDYQRDADDVLGYDKYLAEPHLAAHADGSLHHIYRIETGNHDSRKDSRKDGNDDVSQRQEPQKVEGMEQVDFRIQHRIEQRDECPGNQQAQQEADCREERRLLEIAQHHALYRFAQQPSGSHLLRTVANLSHRKIDVVEQGRKQQNQRHDQEDIHESTIAMLENIDTISCKMNLVPSHKLAAPHEVDSI